MNDKTKAFKAALDYIANGVTCQRCGKPIKFNHKTNKWVTSENHWKCSNDPAFPVMSHKPLMEQTDG